MYEKLVSEYKKKQKKYRDLPDIDELNNEFEICNFVDEKRIEPRFPLRLVRRGISFFVSSWIGYLHDFILPNPQSAIAMEEYKYFSDEEKEEIVQLIAKLMLLNRLNSKMELLHDDTEDTRFITSAFKEWKDIKERILPKLDKNIKNWKKTIK